MSTGKTNRTGELAGRPDRRTFLSHLGAVQALTGFVGMGLLSTPRALANTGALNAWQRRQRAFVIRRDAAIFERDLRPTPSLSNGDEEMYANRIASYSKGLPHSDLGEVDFNAYNLYLHALNTANPADFEAIPLGGTAKLSNPQAAYCYALEGADAAVLAAPPAPAFSSAQAAAG